MVGLKTARAGASKVRWQKIQPFNPTHSNCWNYLCIPDRASSWNNTITRKTGFKISQWQQEEKRTENLESKVCVWEASHLCNPTTLSFQPFQLALPKIAHHLRKLQLHLLKLQELSGTALLFLIVALIGFSLSQASTIQHQLGLTRPLLHPTLPRNRCFAWQTKPCPVLCSPLKHCGAAGQEAARDVRVLPQQWCSILLVSNNKYFFTSWVVKWWNILSTVTRFTGC